MKHESWTCDRCSASLPDKPENQYQYFASTWVALSWPHSDLCDDCLAHILPHFIKNIWLKIPNKMPKTQQLLRDWSYGVPQKQHWVVIEANL